MSTRTKLTTCVAALATATTTLAFAGQASAAPVVRTAAGADAASITPARDLYRLDLGGGNTAGANGSFGGVRREINWDGTPEPISDPALFPPGTFNNRGVNFANAPAFMVSNNATPRFASLNATYPTAFAAFSPQKLFTPVGSTTHNVDFTVPGGTVPATTNGFGAVFTDVDVAGSSKIDYIGVDGKVLYSQAVPSTGNSDGGFSFVGVSFNAGERVATARITTGNSAVTNTPGTSPADITQGGSGDVVVLDDFLYGEPKQRTAASLKFGKLKKKLKIDRGDSKTLKVEFSNGGETTAQNARACLKLNKAAKKKVKPKGGSCKTIGTVAPGETKTAKLKIRSIAGRGTVTGKVQLRADALSPVSRKLKLTVQ
jgi:hypothetical protein